MIPPVTGVDYIINHYRGGVFLYGGIKGKKGSNSEKKFLGKKLEKGVLVYIFNGCIFFYYVLYL